MHRSGLAIIACGLTLGLVVVTAAQETGPASHLLIQIPAGATEATIGSWWDADLQLLPGPGAFPGGAIVVDPVPEGAVARIEAQYTRISTVDQLRAHAGMWDLGSADVSASSARTHALFRARMITRTARIDPTLRPAGPPANARYYLAAIETGRLIEYHFQGSAETIAAGLSGVFPGGDASLSGGRTAAGVSVSLTMAGLLPAAGRTLIGTEADAAAAFVANDSPPVPILAEFVALPRSGRLLVRVTRVVFDPAHMWDGDGPEILMRVQAGGRDVFGTGPRDPYLRGPHNTATFTVPAAAGTIAAPVTVSASSPMQVWFFDEDMMSNDDAGSLEIPTLTPQPSEQCFGQGADTGALDLPYVRFCLMVQDAP